MTYSFTEWGQTGGLIIQTNQSDVWLGLCSGFFCFLIASVDGLPEEALRMPWTAGDTIQSGGGEGEQEEQANKFAADMLIPAPALRKFVADCDGRVSADAVRQFAGEIGIAPGIVVGRLQHDGVIPFGCLNGLKVGYEWG